MTTRSPLHIAVLGGGYAGVIAARRLADGAGSSARVTLVTARPDFVERIRLHQIAAGQTVRARPIAPFLGGAALRIARVQAIDVARQRIVLDDGELAVDRCVNALGSAVAAGAPGVAAHALRLDGPEGAGRVVEAVERARAERLPIAIAGGGLTAIELASELAAAHPGLAVALHCRGAVGEGVLGPAAAAYARAALVHLGVAVHEHAAVEQVERDALIVAGARVPVAATVWCAGFAASPVAAASGLAVDGAGRMIVDEHLAVPGAPWLLGAGDAAIPAAPVGAPLAMSCKTAMPMARHAADNLLATLRDAAPTPFRFGDSGVCVSLGRADGVIEHRRADGTPRSISRGWLGARMKESVCRFTVRALRFPLVTGVFRVYARRGQRVLARGAAPRALPAPGPTP